MRSSSWPERPTKGLPCNVLVTARRFADEHDMRLRVAVGEAQIGRGLASAGRHRSARAPAAMFLQATATRRRSRGRPAPNRRRSASCNHRRQLGDRAAVRPRCAATGLRRRHRRAASRFDRRFADDLRRLPSRPASRALRRRLQVLMSAIVGSCLNRGLYRRVPVTITGTNHEYSAGSEEAVEQVQREVMEYDVVIVGAGPAGLAAAIRLKQLAADDHDASAFSKRAPKSAPIFCPARSSIRSRSTNSFPTGRRGRAAQHAGHRGPLLCAGPAGSVRLPNVMMPPLMNNHGNYAGLARQCLPLAGRAGGGPGRRDLSGLCLFRSALSRRRLGQGRRRRRLRHRQGRHAQARLPAGHGASSANMCSSPRACAARSPRRSSPSSISRPAASRRNSASA